MGPAGLLDAVGAGALLQALRDIAYVVDLDGRILAVTDESWRRFAEDNGGVALAEPGEVVGRPLDDFICDPETRAGYAAMLAALVSGRRHTVAFAYRCDAPELRRDMRMTLSPILREGRPVAVLYQSLRLAETLRPPMALLAAPVAGAVAPADGPPLVAICSYCKSVRVPPGRPGGQWVTPERYYQLGGAEHVRLSHGICPDCRRTIIDPLLEA